MHPTGAAPRNARMTDALPPDPPLAAGRARGIKSRLLQRVADSDGTHLTIHDAEGQWQPFLAGVLIKVLHEHDGVLSYLLRLAPGARLPAHRHPIDEECIVLDGRLRVGTKLEVGPGGYHLAHRGSLHAAISTDTGATVFLRGAVPAARDVLG
jgi:quercetin dioxygenase-like cupin family protein